MPCGKPAVAKCADWVSQSVQTAGQSAAAIQNGITGISLSPASRLLPKAAKNYLSANAIENPSRAGIRVSLRVRNCWSWRVLYELPN
jgi:hypothetical protein